jgi:hypothetical protein
MVFVVDIVSLYDVVPRELRSPQKNLSLYSGIGFNIIDK